MYGMVNEGIRTFILDNHGPEAWQSICETAGLEELEFERMSSYDDAITYKLVGAICSFTGLPASDVLSIFGKYWVEYAGASHFGNLMRLAGNSFIEQLKGLDDMHDRILLSMPHLKPPSFEVDQKEDGSCILHYYSDRDGLAPMVVGLLHGLAKETGESIEVNQVAVKSEQADHDIFEIRILDTARKPMRTEAGI
ncbi:heme NO-binding domain-containing protein [Roseibium sp.]|uniref:heme NO-binding domain-containing protein n=1 Tax=Roseibium sp. TaxID=1936156 RepID=UPI001B00FEBA|nr:heme NO-binding domain-containing protein [Roseibium sp.]MBO6858537.1 heme NO-binding domain-containing protein [Roseibium sp.]